ncbi:MAG: hypothetical protein OEV21_05205 [Thermoplasmata archaeon]|nr:hypothetical protein [Thermoplasmata archaeon]
MEGEIPKEDEIYIKNVFLMTRWIQDKREFTDEEVREMNKTMSKLTEALLKINYNQLIAVLSKYRDHPIYGRSIENVALSPYGREWIRKTLDKVKRIGIN